MLRDVVVRRAPDDELVALSVHAVAPGELMQVTVDDLDAAVPVEVIESRPVMVDGTLRHRLRLRLCDGASA